ncbi:MULTISPECIES: lipoprotein [unclassified Psychrosphaera]|uniref:LPS translocon maturation chaperone LptM n=1 Tax=unclassified Psychrosphaera TaxID=2641570 RepID=UPI00209110C7|nr:MULTISPECIES: lipoprotein [unclassified Psychrosphaera]
MKRPFNFYRKIFAYFIMKMLFTTTLLVAVSGCGLKGPLYLPDQPEKAEVTQTEKQKEEQSSKQSEPTQQKKDNK